MIKLKKKDSSKRDQGGIMSKITGVRKDIPGKNSKIKNADGSKRSGCVFPKGVISYCGNIWGGGKEKD